MRVTDQMQFDSAVNHSQRARDRLASAQTEVATGRRLQHVSDDPAAAGMLMQHRAGEERWHSISVVVTRAADELNAADGALDAVGTAVVRARELAVQLSNDTYNASDRAAAAAELDALIPHVVGALNRQVGGRYIFGGTMDRTPPFDDAGNYLGDTGTRSVEAAPGVTVAANVRADVAIKGVGGGVDVIAVMSALRTALRGNDEAGIRAALDGLAQSTEQVSMARVEAGARASVLDAAAIASVVARDTESTQAASLADADLIDAAGRLAAARRALEAALAAASESTGKTLLDTLR